MTKFIILSCFLMLGFIVKGQTEIPDIEGVWKRTDGTSLSLTKSGSVFLLELSNSGYHHTATLRYKGNDIFKGTMTRRSKTNGCTTYMSVRFEVLDEVRMKYTGTVIDKNCELSEGFQEVHIYRKMD